MNTSWAPRSWALRSWAAVAVLVVALVAAGCGDDDDDDDGGGGDDAASAVTAEDLDGRSFVSDDVDGWDLVEATQVTITFEDDVLAVEAGCNSLHGGYTVADGVLQASTLASTLIGCDEALQAQDEWLLAFFEAGPAVALSGDELTLSTADATIRATDAG